MKTDTTPFDVLVIGAGPGGYGAAFRAADLGLRVALVDPEANPGGVCLYRGCIPSKALLHVAGFVAEAEDAAEWGVVVGDVRVDAAKLREWKEAVVGRLTGGLGQLVKQRKITYIRGWARLTGPNAATVRTPDQEEVEVAFTNAIVATGSVPATIPGMLESPRVMTSRQALDIEDVPERMLVIGGGYIGLELGQVYAGIGSRVSVVEMMPALLPGADRDLVKPLERRLAGQFEAIMLRTRVEAMEETDGGIAVTFGGEEASQGTFERVLVAVGRRPTTGDLGLETTKVVVNERGFIEIDEQRRSAESSIFAIGDVAGDPMLAHKATHEGEVAAEVIAGRKVAFEPEVIPAVVFTDPEIAWCGLTEAEAERCGRKVTVTTFPWAASGRAVTLARTEGLTKLVLAPDDGRVLGAGITGPGAGELLAEATLAIEMGAVAEDLALTVHAHPTLSETLMEAAQAFSGNSTHFVTRKR
ncbi:MAG: dihydrolipoyl dehydrogenase [Lentisphaerae bacterium]|jgi:dihydrolipoamide dehydrogenase|nr:dihydrolipoyl dehydrogenase [Lentisphaerota bacterium]MBT4819812.1 dihydrolipoyl dehydrogenase [Lentisphaerota bacterium]MBT5610832.1 dihydrolipoyl dehydrogenase [Lentisphaerota bacterium]MBT7053736.1 dihydrolipoyl dehydrogenase [Lentisphaerota bacterium]MBT7841197.1 dihydrolipoyl dehydrogenase [Lentisphaerota bacterium]